MSTPNDDELEGFLQEAFRPVDQAGESVLEAIRRLHGGGSSVMLREADEEPAPISLRRSDEGTVEDDSRYQVLGEIARGGIGIVYKTRDKDLQRDVALKVLRPEYAQREDVIQRFVEEAQVGGQLQHPGIVPVYGLGLQADGRPSFAMKLIKGRTLAEVLHGNPHDVDLLSVFEQIAQTMGYAHSRGVIHRDLKPANVMIGAFGEVQVVDWGFAKVLGQEEVAPQHDRTMIATVRSGPVGSQSIAGSVMGTPAYMPPEQAMGQIDDMDERADVFALGAILCEILTGQAPYTGEPKSQLIAAAQCRLDKAHERLNAADAHDDIKQLARNCLEPLLEDRPRNARIVAERLSQHLVSVEERAQQAEVDAIAARNEARLAQQGRRRALGLAAAGFLVVLVAGGGYLAWSHDQASRIRRAAEPMQAALNEAVQAEGREDHATAVAAAQRAVDIAASEGVDGTEARGELERLTVVKAEHDKAARIRTEDDALLTELRHIGRYAYSPIPVTEDGRLAPADDTDARRRAGEQDLRGQILATHGAYDAAFRDRFGSLAAAEARLVSSIHRKAFAGHLIRWAFVCMNTRHPVGEPRALVQLAGRLLPTLTEVFTALNAEDWPELRSILLTKRDEIPTSLLTKVCFLMVQKGGAQPALEVLQARYRLAPADNEVNRGLAEAARKVGRPALAIRHYRAALATEPTNAESWRCLGNAYGEGGDIQRAIEIYRHALQLDPTNSETLNELGSKLRERGHAAEAIPLLQQAVELWPTQANYHNNLSNAQADQGRHEEALASARRAAALDPESAPIQLTLGNRLADRGDLDGAEAAFREVIDHPATGALAWNNLGNLQLKRKRPEEALVCFQRSVAADPQFAGAHINIALVSYALRNYEGSIRAARRAIALDPENPLGPLHLGRALFASGDQEKGLQQMKRAVALGPREGYFHYELGRMLYFKRDLEPALHAFLRAVELDESNAWYNAYAGSMLVSAERHEEALKYYLRAERIDSSTLRTPLVPHGYNAACAAAMAGNADLALRWLRAHVESWTGHLSAQAAAAVRMLEHSKRDADLTSVRDQEDLSEEWKALWRDVDALLARAKEMAK